ncbi:MAG: glycosyltransferase [Mariprofundales bacterium]
MSCRDFSVLFAAAEWTQAPRPRAWVRYRNDADAGGICWHVPASNGTPTISVIVPTADADRGGYFAQLMEHLSQQLWQDFELIVIKGDKRQGRGINTAADMATGRYLMTVDDDSALPDPDTLSKLMAAMESDPNIGMAGGNNTVPENATPFVKQVMREIPRRSWQPVSEIVDSDLAEHPCLIMRAELFRRVGGENELIPRGLDPYLRKQFRDAGSRVVIVPGVIYHHMPPETLRKLSSQFYRNGYQAAYANIHYPQWVIETPSEHGVFVEQVPFWRRALRYPGRLGGALFRGQWIWFGCQLCYIAGFISCNLHRRS